MQPVADITLAELITPGAVTSNTNGSGVAIGPAIGDVVVELHTASGGTGMLTPILQHSADNTTFSNVSGVSFSNVSNVGGIQTVSIDSRELLAYVRLELVVAANTNVIASSAILYRNQTGGNAV